MPKILNKLSPCGGDSCDLEDPIIDAKLAKLQDLINNSVLAGIETLVVTDTEVERVLDHCLRSADEHPQAIERLLLGHDNVRQEALRRLAADTTSSPKDQLCLLKSLLNAGFRIDSRSKLSNAVVDFLEKRKKQEDTYWRAKEDKHKDDESYKGLEAFKTRKPFFYNGLRYSTQNHNGKFGPGLNRLVCRHLAIAVNKEDKKFALEKIAKKDASSFVYDELENLCRKEGGLPPINFTPDNFGKLMIRLAQELKPGVENSFAVNWWADGRGHAMRVFLKREEEIDGGWIKVGLYEPNVSGNVSHLKVLPEDCASLNFDDFDTLKLRLRSDAAVLSLHVSDKDLAERCVGRFVDADRANQVASLEQALAANNTQELKHVMPVIGGFFKKDGIQENELARLSFGLHMALQGGHESTVEKFLGGLKELGLKGDQIADIVSAKDSRNIPGLFVAVQEGHESTVEKFLGGLKELGLKGDQIADIVSAKDCRNIPGLYLALQNGRDSTVEKFLDGLKELGLKGDQIADIVSAKNSDGTSGLSIALLNGRESTVEKFLLGLKDLDIPVERASSLLMSRSPAGRTNVRAIVKSRSEAIAKALTEFVKTISEKSTPNQAAQLLRDLRSAKGANRWYLFGAWKNYKSYNVPAMKKAIDDAENHLRSRLTPKNGNPC